MSDQLTISERLRQEPTDDLKREAAAVIEVLVRIINERNPVQIRDVFGPQAPPHLGWNPAVNLGCPVCHAPRHVTGLVCSRFDCPQIGRVR